MCVCVSARVNQAYSKVLLREFLQKCRSGLSTFSMQNLIGRCVAKALARFRCKKRNFRTFLARGAVVSREDDDDDDDDDDDE